VVKVSPAAGGSIGQVVSAFGVVVDSAMLASRGIYRVHSRDPKIYGDAKKTAELADHIAHSHGVTYAEPDLVIQVADTRFHAWPFGQSSSEGTTSSAFTEQSAVSRLGLAGVQLHSRGDGVVVAVLDTGADRGHPALSGRLLAGWNYVDDDANTSDVTRGLDDNRNGVADEAAGHGTYVAGLVALVAPGAKILPERVLDSDGSGNVFEVAQAILDATAAGARVLNLSFGTSVKLQSHLLEDAINAAKQAGVTVVAAAGNDGSDQPHYPAAQAQVLSVSALAQNGSLATFSDWGSWADVAAPGQAVVGPLPGGRYAQWSGTSVAAPLVSGQVALLLGEEPHMSPDKVVEALSHSSKPLPKHVVQYGAIDIASSLDYARIHH
jgi:subtilisin family serine protease